MSDGYFAQSGLINSRMSKKSEISRLARLIYNHTPYDGIFDQCISGLHINRHSQTDTNWVKAFYLPSVLIVAQGVKAFMLGQEIFQAGRSCMFMFPVALPIALQVIEVIGDTLAGSGKPFVITSVTTMVSSLGRPATEEDQAQAGSPGSPRSAAEKMAIALAERGVRSSAVRLAPCVHDTGRQGFATSLADLAREKGVSAYVGDGSNRWPAIHRLDAANLFRLAVESAPAGSRLHGAGEEGILFRNIAEAIGLRLNLPVSSISREAADEHFGWLAPFVLMDNPTSNVLTRKRLGWEPLESTLIADIAGK